MHEAEDGQAPCDRLAVIVDEREIKQLRQIKRHVDELLAIEGATPGEWIELVSDKLLEIRIALKK